MWLIPCLLGHLNASDIGPSFFHEVVPLLSKIGCSSGACHGSPNGKNGFRLSLRGYDPVADAQSLTRDELGRRVNKISPDLSLLIQKPMMRVPHGGGQQLKNGDYGLEILRRWLRHGCSTAEPAAACVGIRFNCADSVMLSPTDASRRLEVWAKFSDGTERDVSKLAVFSSSDLGVVAVDGDGQVIGKGRGHAAISVRYLEFWRSLFVTYAPNGTTQQATWPNPMNQVDELVDRQLARLQVVPSGLCSDEQFVRRAYLDVIGLLPSTDEVQQFLPRTDPQKREKLIDELLKREEYAKFWALKWGDLLRVNSQQVGNAGVQKYARWLVDSFATNKPYDQFTRELLLAQGSTLTSPAANYYRTATDVNNATESTAQIFMGVRLECCKCHNHPMEKWTQNNYYGFAAFFNRVQRKTNRRSGDLVIWMADSGELNHPRTGRSVAPWLPGIGDVQDRSDGDRRAAFVDWLTAKNNEFLAAVEVNRIWSHLVGRGIVEPIDDFRDSNPPSNPELLAMLADDFRSHGFDRKRTIRLITNSRTYQSASQTSHQQPADEKYFSHYRSRLLTAEQLLDAIGSFTELPEHFRGLPEGTRATQLPSPDINSEFLEAFGQPKRETVCQCERMVEATLSQALQMANGKLVHDKLSSADGRIHRLVNGGTSDQQITHELYMAAYSRKPSERELQTIQIHISKQANRLIAFQDVGWALINSNEFLMQH